MSQAALDALEHYAFSEDAECAGDQADQKRCGCCKASKLPSEFNSDRSQTDGKSNRCKECSRKHAQIWYAKRKREDVQEENEDDKEEEFETSEPASEPGPGDLYVMQNSRTSGEVKVGRSMDVEARRRSLQRSQNYRMLACWCWLFFRKRATSNGVCMKC